MIEGLHIIVLHEGKEYFINYITKNIHIPRIGEKVSFHASHKEYIVPKNFMKAIGRKYSDGILLTGRVDDIVNKLSSRDNFRPVVNVYLKDLNIELR